MVSLSPKTFPRDFAGWRMLLASKKEDGRAYRRRTRISGVIRGHSGKAIITRLPCFSISWRSLEAKLSWNHVESVKKFMQMRKFDSEIRCNYNNDKKCLHLFFIPIFFQMFSDFFIINLRSYSLNSNSQVCVKILTLDFSSAFYLRFFKW